MGIEERQIISPQQQTNNSKPTSTVTQAQRQTLVLPVLCPTLYLSVLQHQPIIKQ